MITTEVLDRKGKDVQTRVQVWFRAPKIWDEFLDAKAAQDYCTKSDLLRHAFRIAYGSELKEFRICLEACGASTGLPSTDEYELFPSSSSSMGHKDIKNDPWIESMVAFVGNKGSCQTRRVYRVVLSQFFTFAAKHASEVRQSDVIRYRHHLEHLGRAPSTIKQHLSAVSGYYNFCISRRITLYNPATGVNRPVVQAYTNASWLDKAQAKLLLSQPNRSTVKGKRDYAILLTLILTGLRRSELTNIRRGDVEERGEKLYLTYICKGGMKIVRDIPRRCWDAIQDYLIASGREIEEDSPLFAPVTEAGTWLKRYYGKNGSNGHSPMTPEAIRQMVTYYSRRAFGPEVRVTPHSLRHTAATLLRKSGRSIEEVQSFLKHRRIDTTRRYLHVVECDDSEFGESIALMLDL